MKLSCSRGALLTAFQTVSGVVPTRTPKAILMNVKLEATPTGTVLIGTDQEIGIRYRLSESNVEIPGEALLPTSRVLSMLREMQGDAVSIETTDAGTVIKGERAQYKLGAENPAEFPNVAEFDEQNAVTIPAAQFKQMIHRRIFYSIGLITKLRHALI